MIMDTHFNERLEALQKIVAEGRRAAGAEGVSPYALVTEVVGELRRAGPKILASDGLPEEIEVACESALAKTAPSRREMMRHLRRMLAFVTGLAGVAVVIAGLTAVLSPGMLATIGAWLFGGIAGGPTAIVAIPGGLAAIAGSLYLWRRRRSPAEILDAALEDIERGIGRWSRRYRKKGRPTSTEALKQLFQKLSEEELPEATAVAVAENPAVWTLLVAVANAECVDVARKQDFVRSLGIRSVPVDRLSVALRIVRDCEAAVRRGAIALACQVATVDGEISGAEVELLRRYARELGMPDLI